MAYRKDGYEYEYEDILARNAQEYLESEERYDEILTPMWDLDEALSDKTPTEIAQMIQCGDFDINDEYFYFDAYGNLESEDCEADYYDTIIDYDEFIEYCKENDLIDSDEEDEEDEEEF